MAEHQLSRHWSDPPLQRERERERTGRTLGKGEGGTTVYMSILLCNCACTNDGYICTVILVVQRKLPDWRDLLKGTNEMQES